MYVSSPRRKKKHYPSLIKRKKKDVLKKQRRSLKSSQQCQPAFSRRACRGGRGGGGAATERGRGVPNRTPVKKCRSSRDNSFRAIFFVLNRAEGQGVGRTCLRNSMDGTGWSLKTAWTDRTAPTAPFRTAAASSSYVRSVRLGQTSRKWRLRGGLWAGARSYPVPFMVEGDRMVPQ